MFPGLTCYLLYKPKYLLDARVAKYITLLRHFKTKLVVNSINEVTGKAKEEERELL